MSYAVKAEDKNLDFTNTYAASGELSLTATKAMEGDYWPTQTEQSAPENRKPTHLQSSSQ